MFLFSHNLLFSLELVISFCFVLFSMRYTYCKFFLSFDVIYFVFLEDVLGCSLYSWVFNISEWCILVCLINWLINILKKNSSPGLLVELLIPKIHDLHFWNCSRIISLINFFIPFWIKRKKLFSGTLGFSLVRKNFPFLQFFISIAFCSIFLKIFCQINLMTHSIFSISTVFFLSYIQISF